MIKTSRYQSNLRASYQKSLRTTGFMQYIYITVGSGHIVIAAFTYVEKQLIGLKISRHFVVQSGVT